MGADAEGEMLARLAVNVENVTVRRELTVVAVGRADEHHHGAALRHRLSVIGDVAGHVARHMRSRRLEAQQFLDGLGDKRGVFGQFPSLIGMFGQYFAGPADQPGRGLIACAGDDADVGESSSRVNRRVIPFSSSNSTFTGRS